MSAASFPVAMKYLAEYEGGYVNDPHDPGGATNRGITQKTYDASRRSKGLPLRHVTMLTDAEHDAIYAEQYWERVRGDFLPPGVDLAVFDFAVNSGVRRASEYLQRIVGAKPDGYIGFITAEAVWAYTNRHGVERLITEYCAARERFLRGLPTFWRFGKGWIRRVVGKTPGAQPGADMGVLDLAIALHRDSSGFLPSGIPRPVAPKAGRATKDAAPPNGLAGLLGSILAAFRRKA
ncbi:MAG: hypothetical protein OEZ19_00120 [Paracoccaceae bacterium]|nr:hypothetical protein [Paracoccaceae bacterium]